LISSSDPHLFNYHQLKLLIPN